MGRADDVNDRLLKSPVIIPKEIKIFYVQYSEILSEKLLLFSAELQKDLGLLY